jgi:hypothetical protein
LEAKRFEDLHKILGVGNIERITTSTPINFAAT